MSDKLKINEWAEEDRPREKLMRQGEFSNEWYEIEQWLRNPEVWDFLTDKSMANHIQLIFELQAHNKNSENYNTYKWFEKEIRNSNKSTERSSELWKETKEIFGRLRYWFKDRTLYHYVGFLLSAFSFLQTFIKTTGATTDSRWPSRTCCARSDRCRNGDRASSSRMPSPTPQATCRATGSSLSASRSYSTSQPSAPGLKKHKRLWIRIL